MGAIEQISVIKEIIEFFNKHRRLGVLLAVVAIVLLIAWLGAFGGPAQRLMIALWGPSLSSRMAAVPAVRLELTIEDAAGQQRAFVEGSVCRAGERIRARVTQMQPAHVLVFGWDGHTPYPLTNGPAVPAFREAGTFEDTVTLDAHPGIETIFLVAAGAPFSFDEVIAPELDRLRTPAGKGGYASHARLSLPERFAVDGAACRHE